MHHAENMVGEVTANYDKSLWRRYFHMSRHTKRGVRIKNFALRAVLAFDFLVGSFAYA